MPQPTDFAASARTLRRIADAGLLVEMRVERMRGTERLTLLTRLGERNVQVVRIDGTDATALGAAACELARRCGVDAESK
jgi:hypothetical protein